MTAATEMILFLNVCTISKVYNTKQH